MMLPCGTLYFAQISFKVAIVIFANASSLQKGIFSSY